MRGSSRFTIRRIGLVFALALAIGPAMAIAADHARPRLFAYTESPSPEAVFSTSEAVPLRFTLRNDSEREVKVLLWHTPVEGFSADIFDVRRDGESVPYIGRLVKRAAPQEKDFVTIAAGSAVSADFDLSAGYDVSRPGVYTVQYREDLLDAGDERSRSPRPIRERFERESEVEPLVESWSLAIVVRGEDRGPQTGADLGTMSLPPTYTGCTNSQRTALNTALGNAENMSIESRNYLTNLPGSQRPTDVRYREWFGAYDSGRYTTVNGHYVSISDAFSNKTVSFFCDCTDSSYAYVYSNRPYEIHLCGAFWTAPALGTDSKAGTLIHEMSHFDVVASTNDYAYGQTACRKLASKQARKAIANADSHEYFAEAGLH